MRPCVPPPLADARNAVFAAELGHVPGTNRAKQFTVFAGSAVRNVGDGVKVGVHRQHVVAPSELQYPKCQGPMRIIALIEKPQVIRRILDHLGRWAPQPAERGPPVPAREWPANVVIPLTYHAVPDIA